MKEHKQMMIKEIKTKEDMTLWAKTINNQPLTNASRCEFQDIWGHSNANLLKQLFIECESDRALIICSLHNTMSYDTVQDMLFHLANTKARKIVEDEITSYNQQLQVKEQDLENRKRTLKESMKSYWKRITLLRTRISDLEDSEKRAYRFAEEMRKENADLRKELAHYKEKAESFDTIQKLLKQ
jgi:hypothetical protein